MTHKAFGSHQSYYIILILAFLITTAAASLAHTTSAQTATKQETKNVGDQRQVKQYTIEQFMDTERVSGSSFSPDEKQILYTSNKTGIPNVYSISIAGGQPVQRTRSTKESTYAVAYFPTDARILYTYDRGGNEINHLYVQMKDGTERDLTPGDKTKAQFYGFSQDDKSFYYATNTRDPRFFDLYKMNIADFSSSLLYQNTVGYFVGDISDDERYIAFSKPNTTADSDIYLYDAKTKETKHLTPHTGETAFSPAAFDPASKYLYYLTNEGGEYTHVARYELATGKREVVERAPWDVSYTYFSRNGRYRVTGINEDGRTRIKIYDMRTGKPIDLPVLPEGDVTSVNISRSEQLMAFYHNGDRTPGNLHVYDFSTKRVARLTNTLNPEIDPADLVEARVVRYKSFDGMEIPALLYQPHGASATNKMPAIVEVHGGPGGQSRKGYAGGYQYLVNHGYVILRVNNRGSSGYGKTFYTADDGRHGREPLDDCVAAKKYLASLDYVDASKIGIMGGSYGGYMTLAALAFRPEEFTVGVDIFGVSNWVRTLSSIPSWWEARRKALYKEIGDPVKDKEMLEAISPLFHANKITKPLIVIQGANDPRVIRPESDEIVEAVKRKGGVIEYVVFPDEGHGFSKKANELQSFKAILNFLDQHLKGSKPASVAKQ